MFVRTESEDGYIRKNNCNVRQLYPWDGVVVPPWNATIVTVDVGESTTRHHHDTDETFIFTSGSGEVWIGSDRRSVAAGDVIYIPHGIDHTVTNRDESEPLELISIYWPQPAAVQVAG